VYKVTKYWQDSLNLLIGVVLFFSPWLFDFATEQTAALNAHIAGAVIAVVALGTMLSYQAWEEWLSGLLGVWLIIAPWVLGFSGHTTAMFTHIAFGAATLILAIWAANEHGSGHMRA
jgi:hypothetical protein